SASASSRPSRRGRSAGPRTGSWSVRRWWRRCAHRSTPTARRRRRRSARSRAWSPIWPPEYVPLARKRRNRLHRTLHVNWINNLVRPKIRSLLNKREVPENLWIKCPETGEMVFHRDLEANDFVIPGSGYHMRMGAKRRLAFFFDGG